MCRRCADALITHTPIFLCHTLQTRTGDDSLYDSQYQGCKSIGWRGPWGPALEIVGRPINVWRPIFWTTCLFNFHYLGLLSLCFKSVHKFMKTTFERWLARQPGKTCLRNDLVCVEWGPKTLLTHSFTHSMPLLWTFTLINRYLHRVEICSSQCCKLPQILMSVTLTIHTFCRKIVAWHWHISLDQIWQLKILADPNWSCQYFKNWLSKCSITASQNVNHNAHVMAPKYFASLRNVFLLKAPTTIFRIKC